MAGGLRRGFDRAKGDERVSQSQVRSPECAPGGGLQVGLGPQVGLCLACWGQGKEATCPWPVVWGLLGETGRPGTPCQDTSFQCSARGPPPSARESAGGPRVPVGGPEKPLIHPTLMHLLGGRQISGGGPSGLPLGTSGGTPGACARGLGPHLELLDAVAWFTRCCRGDAPRGPGGGPVLPTRGPTGLQ